MLRYLLIYQLTDDYLARRGEFREEHLRLAQEQADNGMLMLGGALKAPTDQAMMLFHDQRVARRFAETDPYVTNGLVTSWSVRRWTTTVGTLASDPVSPE